ncbi:MAG: helix-turn-helix domain-containing protein [Microthrixaceae bacterium]
MDVATLISAARHRAGLTQRQLAARARTSAAAVCQYERGERIPRVDTLQRLIAATGATLTLDAPAPSRLDPRASGRDLEAVLGLADALPKRHEPDLRYPAVASLLGRR